MGTMPYWFDGNNLIGQPVSRARLDRQTREAFLGLLSTYHRRRGGRFTVYFDGDDPDRAAAPPGVSVRYCAPLSTDDTILRRLAESRSRSEVTVVTNDRSLGNRCRNEGARLMDWQEFRTKMSAANLTRAVPQHDAEEEVDLDEWTRFFGFDRNTLK
jgi:predicted RNA-binding protein with PIN domain